jgi:SAM-dependent methyltransferase
VTRPGEHVSEQWARWREAVDLAEYESRFTDDAAHGEADFIAAMDPRSVLDAGCGTGRLAIELDRRGIDVVGVDLDPDLLDLARQKAPNIEWVLADLAKLRLGRTFDVVVMAGNVMLFCRPSERSAVVDSCSRHVVLGGPLVSGFSLSVGLGGPSLAAYDQMCASAGLVLAERWGTWERAPYAGAEYAVSVHRRNSLRHQSDL